MSYTPNTWVTGQAPALNSGHLNHLETQYASAMADATAIFELKSSVNVMDFGAVGDGVTDDTVAFQNAINSVATTGGIVRAPTAVYCIAGTLNLVSNAGVTLAGDGWKATQLLSSSTTADLIFIDPAASWTVIRDLSLDRSVTATAGNGINVAPTGVITYATIRNVYVRNQFRGVRLGPSTYGQFHHCIVEQNIDDGIFITNSPTTGALQWALNEILSQKNGGNGFRVFSQNTGPVGCTMGDWSNIYTFANSKAGVSIEGVTGCPISGVRINTAFLGEDATAELYMDSYGGYHIINNVFCELSGTRTTGPTMGTAATGAAHGVQLTANNTEVSWNGGTSRNNTYSGINSSAAFAIFNGVWLVGNGTTATAGIPLHCGLYVAAGDATVSGSYANSQAYGVYTAVDAVLITGNRLKGTTAATGSAVTLTSSVVANNRTV